MYSGRGGSCLLNAPFFEDLLLSLGFRAHLVYAFNAARSLRRVSPHLAVIARDVEAEGDAFYADAGTPAPCFGVTDIADLLSPKEGAEPKGALATLHMQYMVKKYHN